MKNLDALIAITTEDGFLHVMSLAVRARGNVLPSGAVWFNDGSGWWFRDPTPDVIESEIAKVFPTGPKVVVSWRKFELGELPSSDRTYRNAWKDTGARIEHDMPKAREVHRDLIRKQRSPVFADLDGQWMRAMGKQDVVEIQRVEAERQKWRDAPADPRIDAASSIEELKLLKVE